MRSISSRVAGFLEEYSVSNRGMRTGLAGMPDQIIDRLRASDGQGSA